jgi:hypothetical protein
MVGLHGPGEGPIDPNRKDSPTRNRIVFTHPIWDRQGRKVIENNRGTSTRGRARKMAPHMLPKRTPMNQGSKLQGFPTVLVVGNDDRVGILIQSLQHDGYSVLVASNPDDAVRVVRTHSRQIHMLVVHDSANAPNLVELLEPFRLGVIPALYISGYCSDALADVREHVKPPTPRQTLTQKDQAA